MRVIADDVGEYARLSVRPKYSEHQSACGAGIQGLWAFHLCDVHRWLSKRENRNTKARSVLPV